MTKDEAIARLKEGEPFSEIYDKEWEDALQMAIETLERPEPRWTPCSERLPHWGDDVLVTTSAGILYIAWKLNGQGWAAEDFHLDDHEVLAFRQGLRFK